MTTKDEPAYLAVLRRDPCTYCGAPATVLDHITARTRGGRDGWANRTAACGRCNSRKRTSSLLAFLLWERIEQEWADVFDYAQEVHEWAQQGRRSLRAAREVG